MKNLNQIEVELLADWIRQEAVGAQLQSILHHEKGLGLELYKKGTIWLIIDLSVTGPFCSVFRDKCPWVKSRKTKPLGLFLNSNAKNLDLVDVKLSEGLGRVIDFHFSTRPNSPDPRQCLLQFQMIPKRVNLMASSGKKSIYWAKPIPLAPQNTVPQSFHSAGEQKSSFMAGALPTSSDSMLDTAESLALECRSLKTILAEWQQSQISVSARKGESFQVQSSAPGDALRKQWQKDLAKKQKAVVQIQQQIQEQQELSSLLYEIGQELKFLSLNEVLKKHPFVKELNKEESLSWNMENVFKKAKVLSQKKEGAERRIQDVLVEIHKLEKRLSLESLDLAALEKEQRSQRFMSLDGQSHGSIYDQGNLAKSAQGKASKSKNSHGANANEVKARKKVLGPELVAFKGKSAKDNLSLLRSAKAWDYWFHLKDYPSSHAILRRNKNQNIKPDQIREIAEWMAEDFITKKNNLSGSVVDVVYVECRFVRPIKGDKIGRVQYHSEQSVRVKLGD